MTATQHALCPGSAATLRSGNKNPGRRDNAHQIPFRASAHDSRIGMARHGRSPVNGANSDHTCGSLCRWRRHRHRRAPHRRQDVSGPRPIRHRRKRRRRWRHHRQRTRRPLNARRHLHPDQSRRTAGSTQPVHGTALRHHNRLRARRPRQQRSDGPDRPKSIPGQSPKDFSPGSRSKAPMPTSPTAASAPTATCAPS